MFQIHRRKHAGCQIEPDQVDGRQEGADKFAEQHHGGYPHLRCALVNRPPQIYSVQRGRSGTWLVYA